MTSPPPTPLPIADPIEVRSALQGVRDRDRRVIELRYGLEGERQHSRAEIGQMMGISRERVRQLEKRALERLDPGADAPGGGQARPSPARRGAAETGEPSRRSFLRSWTLLLLQLGPAHVYALRARLRDLGLPPANYRLLQALESEGFLRSEWAPGRGAGPSRRVYSLTPRGVRQLQEDAPTLARMAHTLEAFLSQDELRSPPGREPGGASPEG